MDQSPKKPPADENAIIGIVLILIVFASIFAVAYKLAGDHRDNIETYLQQQTKEQPKWPF